LLRRGFCWSRLTHLKMRFIEAEECLRVLSQASVLVACHILGLRERREIFQNSPVVLSHLRFLHISAYDYMSLMVLRFLTCPALRKLHIEYNSSFGDSIQSFWHSDLVAFLSRTSGSVEHLTICGLELSDVRLIECLRVLPKLTTLSIEDYSKSCVTDALLEALTSGPENTNPLVPILTSFHLSATKNPIDAYAVVEMVERRCWSSDLAPFRTLKFLRLKGPMPITEAELARLKQALGDGLDVRELLTDAAAQSLQEEPSTWTDSD